MHQFALQERVHLVGKLDFTKLKEQLKSAHAYVQSSLAEGLSNSLVEAMALGCPVFATDVGGTSEIIHDGENGFLLPALTPEVWVDKLKLAKNVTLMKKVRTAAFETAHNYFSAEVHAREFTEFYERALAGASHTREGVIEESVSKPSQPDKDAERDHMPLILIKGLWEWKSGADQALRAVGAAVRQLNSGFETKPLSVVLCGHGEQEDELRYLAYALSCQASIDVRFVPIQQDERDIFSEERAAVQIRLPDDVSGSYMFCSIEGMISSVGFGEQEELAQHILKALMAFHVNAV